MKKKVLICGSTGFIGCNMAEAFAEDDQFEVFGTYFQSTPLSHPRIHMIQADLRDPKAVDRAVKGKDIIIQAAATTSGAKDTVTKPYYHVTDNAIINALLFRSAFENKIAHLIFLSCTTMYQSSDQPIKETDFNAQDEIYPRYFGGAWTKVYNEKMCEFYSRISETKYTVIRHSNVYGPYDKYDLERSHVFGATITKVMTAPDNGEIIVWGEGTERRDLIHVSDLISFVQAVISKQQTKFELFNAGSEEAASVKELVAKMIRQSGKKLVVTHDRSKPTIQTNICLNIDKAKQQLGWSPKISLDQGIQKTMQWYWHHILKQETALCE